MQKRRTRSCRTTFEDQPTSDLCGDNTPLVVPFDDQPVVFAAAASFEGRCDARGNCEGERAALIWRDPAGALHRGSIVDVYLPRR